MKNLIKNLMKNIKLTLLSSILFSVMLSSNMSHAGKQREELLGNNVKAMMQKSISWFLK